MAGDPVQRDPVKIEMDLAGLDLYRAGIYLVVEPQRTQHREPPGMSVLSAVY